MILEALQIPFAAAYLHMAADVVTCEVQTSPRIHVRPIAKPVKFNHRRSMQELTDGGTDTISPYPKHIATVTGGTTESYIRVNAETKFEVKSFPAHGLACVYYSEITVNIELDPTIYVAKEHGRSSCEYREIMKHERKHVDTDRQIVNKYAKQMGQTLQASINNSLVRGPYPLSRLKDIQQSMLEYVVNTLKTQQSLMEEDRFRSQQAVDSLEEYERVRLACDRGSKSRSAYGGRR